MGYRNTFYRIFATVIFCLTASLTSFTAVAEEERAVIVMDTFDVHGNAEGFFKLIDQAIKLAKETDPEGGGQIHVLAGHSDPGSASTVIVFTTFPSMDAYVNNSDSLKASPKMQAIYKEMQDAKFEFVGRTMNTLVAEY